jgi:multiple sugar transport system substrate-binding protein
MQPGTDYGAFFMPPKEPNTKQAVFTEGGAWLVPKNSPNQKAAVAQLSHWLDPAVQGVWSDFLGDSSANPTVAPTNPVIKGLDDEVAKTKPVLMNRYYESFPPNLVQESTSTLDGFMVNPDSLQSTTDALKASAQKEWAAWKASK